MHADCSNPGIPRKLLNCSARRNSNPGLDPCSLHADELFIALLRVSETRPCSQPCTKNADLPTSCVPAFQESSPAAAKVGEALMQRSLVARRRRARSDCKDTGGELSLNKVTLGQNRTTLAHMYPDRAALPSRDVRLQVGCTRPQVTHLGCFVISRCSRHCWICRLEVESIHKILTLYHKRNSVSNFSLP